MIRLRLSGLLVGLAVAGCATVHTKPPPFDTFPERFDAIQVMKVEGMANGSPIEREFLVSVKRAGESVDITFMDPFWQKALFRVSYGVAGYSVTPLVQNIELPFAGEEIVDTAREVFRWQGRLDDAGEAKIQTPRFWVKIGDVGRDGTCLFPRRIELKPRVPDAPRMTITTKDWRCP